SVRTLHTLHPLFICRVAPPAQLSPLSLHDALPISAAAPVTGTVTVPCYLNQPQCVTGSRFNLTAGANGHPVMATGNTICPFAPRSEEHTSELQSRFDLVCRLLLETKKETTMDDADK